MSTASKEPADAKGMLAWAGERPGLGLGLAAGAAVGLFALWEWRRRKDWPPIAPFSLIENASIFATQGHKVPFHILDCFDKTGPIFRLRMPTWEHMVWVCDPEEARVLLEGDPARGITPLDKGSTHKEFDMVTNGPSIFSLETRAHSWVLTRKGSAPAFSSKNIDLMHRKMLDSVKLFEQNVLARSEKSGTPWMLEDWCQRLTMEVMYGSMFLDHAKCLDPDTRDGPGMRILDIISELLSEVNPRRMGDATRKYMIFHPQVRRCTRLAKEACDIARGLLDKYRAERTAAEIEQDMTVMGFLCRAEFESDEARLADMVTYLVAGYDTTSSALGWGLSFLHKHPSALAALRTELDKINPARKEWTTELLDKCTYLQWVVWETLRLGTPGVAVLRYNPMFGPERWVSGYKIPPMSRILISMMVPAWRFVTDGEEFRPERWDPAHPEAEQLRKAAASAPFSLGKRACLGKNLAKRELHVFLASISQRWDIGIAKEDAPSYSLTFSPGKCEMTATRRKPVGTAEAF